MISNTSLYGLFACLSVLASALLMIMTWFQKKSDSWHSAFQLVFFMSLGDFLLSFTQCLSFLRYSTSNQLLQRDDFFCAISFFMQQFGGISTVVWYFMLALNILLIIRGKTELQLRPLLPFQHAFVWLYTFGATLPSLIMNQYDPMGVDADYCWFVNSNDLRRLLFYLPLALTTLFCIFLLLYVIVNLIRGRSTTTIFRRLAFMLVVFIVVWGLPLFDRLLDFFGGQELDLQMVGLTLSGTCNFIVWGLTNEKLVKWVSKEITVCCHFLLSDSYVSVQINENENIHHESLLSRTPHSITISSRRQSFVSSTQYDDNSNPGTPIREKAYEKDTYGTTTVTTTPTRNLVGTPLEGASVIN